MKQSTIEAYLGRPLTSLEVTNKNLYLELARERLEDLTCLNLEKTTEDRTFNVRENYQTVFTDLFTEVNSVVIDGNAVTEYTPYQWDRRNANWYNSIVLNTSADEIVINADWGVCSPQLQQLQAKLFGLVTEMNVSAGNVKSKSVEDFSITFKDNTVYDQFVIDNQPTINKYSICNIGQIKSGEVYGYYYEYGIR